MNRYVARSNGGGPAGQLLVGRTVSGGCRVMKGLMGAEPVKQGPPSTYRSPVIYIRSAIAHLMFHQYTTAMYMILRMAFALFLFVGTANAQTTFHKALGRAMSDEAADMVRTADGSLVVAGRTVHPVTLDQNILLVKFTESGDTVWTRSIGADGVNEDAVSVRETDDGGLILCGTQEIIAVAPGNILLVRTNDLGQPIWSKTFGGATIETGKGAEETSDGGFIVLGSTSDLSVPAKMCLIKTDAAGDTTWTRILGTTPNRYDFAESIVETTDGGYLITGGGYQSGVFQGTYLIRTDPFGAVLWAKSATGMPSGIRVVETVGGGSIVLGIVPANSIDLHAIRFDALGDTLWSRSYGGSSFEEAEAVIQTSDEGFLFAGATRSFSAGLTDAYFVRTDAAGNIVWTRAFGQSQHDRFYAVQELPDHSFAAVGHTTSFGSGQSDVFLVRADSAGATGCDELAAATLMHTPAMTMGNVTFQAASGIPVGNATLAWSAGSIPSTECFTVHVPESEEVGPWFAVRPTVAEAGSPVRIEAPRGEYRVMDITGRIVVQRSIDGVQEFLLQRSGTYAVQFKAASGTTRATRIMIQ